MTKNQMKYHRQIPTFVVKFSELRQQLHHLHLNVYQVPVTTTVKKLAAAAAAADDDDGYSFVGMVLQLAVGYSLVET